MKRLILLLLPFIALITNAGPITSFPNGFYVGSGTYYKDSGDTGNYNSLVEFNNNEIKVQKIVDGKITSGEVSITFVNEGFFTASIQSTDLIEGTINNYTGKGYCVSDACHVYVKLGDKGFAEATLLFDFANGLIRRVGSAHLANGTDEQGNIIYQVISFEELLTEIEL